MKVKVLYAYNAILALLAIVVLFLGSLFWLGTVEGHDQAISTSAMSYFSGRLLISLLISLGLSFLIFMINFFYRIVFKLALERRHLVKITLIEFALFVVASIVFVLIGMYRQE